MSEKYAIGLNIKVTSPCSKDKVASAIHKKMIYQVFESKREATAQALFLAKRSKKGDITEISPIFTINLGKALDNYDMETLYRVNPDAPTSSLILLHCYKVHRRDFEVLSATIHNNKKEYDFSEVEPSNKLRLFSCARGFSTPTETSCEERSSEISPSRA